MADSQTRAFTAKVQADDPAYKERVAEPTMAAVDAMPTAFRAMVHEFGYIDVYRAWRKGWTVEQIRAKAAAGGGVFEL